MKKTFLVIIACVLVLGVGTAKAERWQDGFQRLPLVRRQGIDQVASKFGRGLDWLRALYIVGRERNQRVILPAGHSLLWTIWRDGWVSCVFRTDKPLSGKQVSAKLYGEPIALFYPDDKSFLFAVLDRPVNWQKSSMTKFNGRQEVVSRTAEWQQEAPTTKLAVKQTETEINMMKSERAYNFLNEEIYVPPTQ